GSSAAATTSSGFQPSTPPPQEVTMTLSLPLVLADGDAAVVAGDGQRDPAASAPVTFDFMGSPGIAGTAHDRRAARPPHPRKYWSGYGPAGVWTPGPRRATTWCCAHRVVSRNCGRRALRVTTTCRGPLLYSRKGLLSAVAWDVLVVTC